MLVCSVSLRSLRRAIAAELAEISAAVDTLGTGNVVFATLVDDPASMGDIVDAYLGEIMLEATSADAVIDAGLVYATAINEATTAADLQDGAVPGIYAAAIVEAATADASPNASIAAAAAVTTMAAGPLLAMDTSFTASKLTVIKAGR